MANGGEARLVGSIMQAWRSDTDFDVLVWCQQKIAADKDKDMLHYLIEPALFYLALVAGAAGPLPGSLGVQKNGESDKDWLGNRAYNIYVAHAHEIIRFGYAAGFRSPDHAREYLAELTTDFLDPGCLDLLPLTKIIERWDLFPAISRSDDKLGKLPGEFAALLEEHLAEDSDKDGRWNRWLTPMVELVNAKVPADAFAKIRRRFRMFPFFEDK